MEEKGDEEGANRMSEEQPEPGSIACFNWSLKPPKLPIPSNKRLLDNFLLISAAKHDTSQQQRSLRLADWLFHSSRVSILVLALGRA
jgi:hypothetical protein